MILATQNWTRSNLGPVLSTGIFLFRETKEFRRNYLEKLLSINFGFQFWLFHVPLIYLIAFISIYFQKLFFDFSINITPCALFMITLEMLLYGVASGGLEELGWRDYSRISLNTDHGYFVGSVILGLVWSIWHVPLFLINGAFSGLNFIFFIFLEIVYSMILELVMIKTEGRTFAAILHHGAANHAIKLFSILSVEEIGNQYSFYIISILVMTTGFMLLLFIKKMKRKGFQRLEKSDNWILLFTRKPS